MSSAREEEPAVLLLHAGVGGPLTLAPFPGPGNTLRVRDEQAMQAVHVLEAGRVGDEERRRPFPEVHGPDLEGPGGRLLAASPVRPTLRVLRHVARERVIRRGQRRRALRVAAANTQRTLALAARQRHGLDARVAPRRPQHLLLGAPRCGSGEQGGGGDEEGGRVSAQGTGDMGHGRSSLRENRQTDSARTSRLAEGGRAGSASRFVQLTEAHSRRGWRTMMAMPAMATSAPTRSQVEGRSPSTSHIQRSATAMYTPP